MTYESTEVSAHDGRPVELYRYRGTYQDFYYTSSQKIISFQAADDAEPHNYIPIAMRRSAVSDTNADDDNAEITIEMPVSTDIVSIYGFQIAPPALELTIFRQHNPGEYIQYWSGPVENINVVRGTATLRIPSYLASALSSDLPNVYFQSPCNHTLFDARCKVPIEDWSFTAEIATIDSNVITVDSIGTLDGNLVGGDAALPSGERRMIVSQDALELTLNYPFAGADVGDAVILAAGCDLAFTGDCRTRFDNNLNFGGFPFIPPVNIFDKGIEPGKSVEDTSCLPPTFSGWYWQFEIEWEVGGLTDNAKPGNFGASPTVNGIGPSESYASPDFYYVRFRHSTPGAPYAVNDPSGAVISIVNQTSFGTSGIFRLYFQHWTWTERVQMTVDNVDTPFDDSLHSDNAVYASGVFPRSWTIHVP